MPGSHDSYSALRHSSFRRVLGGNVLSGFAFEMQHAAVSWELYERTDSAMALGNVGLVQFLPVLLFAIPAGHLADRWNQKWLAVAALGIAILATTGLGLLSHYRGPVPLVYLCLFVHGMSRALSAPARSSLIAFVVPLDNLANAIAWGSTGWQMAQTLGPAIGGVLIARAGGAQFVYLATAVTTVAAAGLIASSRPRHFQRIRQPMTWSTLLAGVRFVWRHELLLASLSLDLFAVLLGGATALLPVFAKDILHVGPVGFGWLRAAPAIGAIVMAVVLAHRRPLRRAGRTLLWSVAGFGLATIGFGLSHDPYLSFTLLAISGALDNISIVVRGTLVQRLTPDAMRGRVSAVNSIFIVTSNELGSVRAGYAAAWIGPVLSVVLGGFGTVLVVLAAAQRWPQVRQLGVLNEVSPSEDFEVDAK
jgi:MFS family permease